jgi:fructoselysine 6-phosphate deglycase
MATDFDRTTFLRSMETAVIEKDRAAKLGTEFAKKGIRRIILVGCGAPNREMSVIQYWVDLTARHLECRRYFPAELTNQKPPILDQDTVVIFGSHSGTTPETVLAAQWARTFPCVTVGITQQPDSPLGKEVQHTLTYGKSPNAGYQHGYYSLFMLALALVSAMLKEIEGWTLHEKVMSALDVLPSVLADSSDASEARIALDARLYHEERTMYVVASGPMFCTAYVTGVCVLMEMQWMHVYPAEAAEWFHGPFEIIDETSTVLLMLGEDPSRPEMERVARFCKKYTERLLIYDSRDFEMKGIDSEVRPIFAPFIVQSAMDRLGEHLAVWHNHPLTSRRYMWKTDY